MSNGCDVRVGYVSLGVLRWARGCALSFTLPIAPAQYDLTGKWAAFRLRHNQKGEDIFRVTKQASGGTITWISPGASGQKASILIPWNTVSEHNGSSTLTGAVGVRERFYFAIEFAAVEGPEIDFRVQGDFHFPPDTGADGEECTQPV